ncbi:MBL fold metallo-hydrolase [Bacillus sp. M6-12]|uniref:MBL fold metallo-hydrolase n=1 Tax=Bacillus sp. M6-12 TaxID=2054166 RepID=UPI0015E061DE|nr:MBL fold metallo-hydrolase [Bacillus sp. M6-12]
MIGTNEMNSFITEVYQNIYKVSLSIPVPLKAINVYLIKGSNGWTIIDCGFRDEETEKTWEQVFKELKIKDNVSQIIVTHYHPDHFGAAGWLQEKTGADVLLLDKEKKYLDLNWLDESYPLTMKRFFTAYGMPEDIASGVEEEHISRYPAVSPHPRKISLISEGDEIEIGNYNFKAIWSPGHTEGLMTFWDERNGIFISNDLVLPKITPNISFQPNSGVNPLSDFISSLTAVRELPAEITLTGHRQSIFNLRTRINEIIHHHKERLEKIYSLVKNKGKDNGVSGWDISKELFGELKEPVQHKFAFAESLAHLEYLLYSSELKKKQANGQYYYYI